MTTPTQTTPLLLSQLNATHNLQDALSRMEAEVRNAPASADHRWALAELLCVLGHWERALKQLQVGAKLVDAQNAQWHSKAQMLRSLIRAEAQRTEVFSGKLLPTPVIDRPQWMEDMAHAIAINAKGQHQEADTLRLVALDVAPTRPGQCSWHDENGHQHPESEPSHADELLTETAYEWISDSDTRLGPVCELIVAGGYRWLAFADIATIEIALPSSLLDLVWLPVTLRLRSTEAGARPMLCYMPARYSGTETTGAEIGTNQRDALMLSRLTRWQNVGETGVFALGQKTLMTSAGDIPLLGLRHLSGVAPLNAQETQQ